MVNRIVDSTRRYLTESMNTLKEEDYEHSSSIITIPLELITKEMKHYDANFTDTYNEFIAKVKKLKSDDQAKVDVRVKTAPAGNPTRILFTFVISKETDLDKALSDLS